MTRAATDAPPQPEVDRAAAVRAALRRLVARQGFHGTSMSAVAAEAGVGTGTAYVHYESKDELVLAAYVEEKQSLGRAALERVEVSAPPADRFRQLWFGVHDHLRSDEDLARFLVQVEASPYGTAAHERSAELAGDALVDAAESPDMAALLVPLPASVLYDLAIGPVVRLAASRHHLDRAQLEVLAASCWRAITR